MTTHHRIIRANAGLGLGAHGLVGKDGRRRRKDAVAAAISSAS